MDFSVKGLKPLALKEKAHEYIIENPLQDGKHLQII